MSERVCLYKRLLLLICVCMHVCAYVFVCELISISVWALKWTRTVLFVCFVLFLFSRQQSVKYSDDKRNRYLLNFKEKQTRKVKSTPPIGVTLQATRRKDFQLMFMQFGWQTMVQLFMCLQQQDIQQ